MDIFSMITLPESDNEFGPQWQQPMRWTEHIDDLEVDPDAEIAFSYPAEGRAIYSKEIRNLTGLLIKPNSSPTIGWRALRKRLMISSGLLAPLFPGLMHENPCAFLPFIFRITPFQEVDPPSSVVIVGNLGYLKTTGFLFHADREMVTHVLWARQKHFEEAVVLAVGSNPLSYMVVYCHENWERVLRDMRKARKLLMIKPNIIASWREEIRSWSSKPPTPD